MEQKLKLLVAGNVRGNYSKLFQRVTQVNFKAGPFDLLLCIGDFFGSDIVAYNELINGCTVLPNVSTYILGKIPRQLLQFHPNVSDFDQGCELIDGITFLGRYGMLTTSHGLKIAYLNGSYKNEIEKDDDLEYFTKKEYESLLMSHQSSSDIVDILLTTQWPKNVFNFTTVNLNESVQNQIEQDSSHIISQLCSAIRPRMHFVGGLNVFYERAPFRNHKIINEASKNVTRFISIADIANSQKMKWLYAFNIVPSRHLPKLELVAQPDGVTENPFIKTSQNDESEVPQDSSKQFFFDMSTRGDNSSNEYHKRRHENNSEKRPRKQMKVDLENCWFCLASPNVDKTLIVSIGDFSYLALAKGGLTDDHLMILPIEHIRSTMEIDESELKQEIDKFKQSLILFFEKRNQVPVFFERNFRSAHFQIQVIGIPESKASSLKQAVSEVFHSLQYHEISLKSELEDMIPVGVPYFYFECPGHYKFFVRINVKREFFPIQIGRELLAHKSLLDCPERVDWKHCTSSSEEAKQLAKSIRNDFKPFDFTL